MNRTSTSTSTAITDTAETAETPPRGGQLVTTGAPTGRNATATRPGTATTATTTGSAQPKVTPGRIEELEATGFTPMRIATHRRHSRSPRRRCSLPTRHRRLLHGHLGDPALPGTEQVENGCQQRAVVSGPTGLRNAHLHERAERERHRRLPRQCGGLAQFAAAHSPDPVLRRRRPFRRRVLHRHHRHRPPTRGSATPRRRHRPHRIRRGGISQQRSWT